jgi:hypothetical protein
MRGQELAIAVIARVTAAVAATIERMALRAFMTFPHNCQPNARWVRQINAWVTRLFQAKSFLRRGPNR